MRLSTSISQFEIKNEPNNQTVNKSLLIYKVLWCVFIVWSLNQLNDFEQKHCAIRMLARTTKIWRARIKSLLFMKKKNNNHLNHRNHNELKQRTEWQKWSPFFFISLQQKSSAVLPWFGKSRQWFNQLKLWKKKNETKGKKISHLSFIKAMGSLDGWFCFSLWGRFCL